jgi:hypothetical protein
MKKPPWVGFPFRWVGDKDASAATLRPQYAIVTIPAKPKIIISQVEGSGIAAVIVSTPPRRTCRISSSWPFAATKL